MLQALLESVGTKTRLVAVSTLPTRALNHIFVEAWHTGTWHRLDPIGERYDPRRFVRAVVREV